MKKVIDIKKLANIISKSKKKTVLCHGVFDILHTGHLDHFYQAKKLADILIVSVTDDEFVKKGINRPINKIYDRIKMVKIENLFLCPGQKWRMTKSFLMCPMRQKILVKVFAQKKN